MALRTPLFEVQSAAGGKIVDFAGWDMPVQFAGINAEHLAVRTACGVFDVCHMGRLRIIGPDAAGWLERRVCRGLAGMATGAVRYGMVLAADGTVEDDVLVSREGDYQFHVVVNAGNRAKILEQWLPQAGTDVVIQDLSQQQAMIAVQGPKAIALLAGMGLDGSKLGYYRFADATWQGIAVRLSRTGYTGEDGCECFLDAAHAPRFWQAVVAAGATPCGLGCRDTLRMEAAMPLYGHELDRTVTPVMAGLGFALNPKGGYIGAEAIAAQLAAGPPRKLVGLRMDEKRVPRQAYAVTAGAATVGAVTSGTLSPTLGFALGMAYVETAHAAPGTRLAVDIRGTAVPATVVALPFYKRPS